MPILGSLFGFKTTHWLGPLTGPNVNYQNEELYRTHSLSFCLGHFSRVDLNEKTFVNQSLDIRFRIVEVLSEDLRPVASTLHCNRIDLKKSNKICEQKEDMLTVGT